MLFLSTYSEHLQVQTTTVIKPHASRLQTVPGGVRKDSPPSAQLVICDCKWGWRTVKLPLKLQGMATAEMGQWTNAARYYRETSSLSTRLLCLAHVLRVQLMSRFEARKDAPPPPPGQIGRNPGGSGDFLCSMGPAGNLGTYYLNNSLSLPLQEALASFVSRGLARLD